MIVCDVSGCPCKIQGKFCGKKVLGVNQSGMCKQIYNNRGQVRPDWQQKREQLVDMKIEEFQGTGSKDL